MASSGRGQPRRWPPTARPCLQRCQGYDAWLTSFIAGGPGRRRPVRPPDRGCVLHETYCGAAAFPWNSQLTLTFFRGEGGAIAMSFEDKEAELGLLLTRMQNEPEDCHELYAQIRQKLNELKAYGMPLPDTLVRLERQLEAEFEAERDGG